MDELSLYVVWAKDFKMSDEGVRAFQAIRREEKIRGILLQNPDDALEQIRAVILG